MRRSRGKAPAARQVKAALGLFDLAHRLIGRRNEHRAAIVAPHLALRLVVEEREFIGVATEHAIDPAGRHAAFGERLLHLEEDIGVHLIAAPALRLEDTEEARILHLGDGRCGHIAVERRLARARLEGGYHRAGALDQLRGGGQGDVCGLLRGGGHMLSSGHLCACGRLLRDVAPIFVDNDDIFYASCQSGFCEKSRFEPLEGATCVSGWVDAMRKMSLAVAPCAALKRPIRPQTAAFNPAKYTVCVNLWTNLYVSYLMRANIACSLRSIQGAAASVRRG